MADVRLILREDVPKLGDAGEVVSVKPGYARNYLIPTGKAIHATAAKVRELEHHQRQIAEKVAKQRTELEAERDRIQGTEIQVAAQAGEGGRLFGSVTAMQIAELLGEKGVTVDRRRIELAEPIKEVGDFRVPIRLHREVVAEILVKVVPAE